MLGRFPFLSSIFACDATPKRVPSVSKKSPIKNTKIKGSVEGVISPEKSNLNATGSNDGGSEKIVR